MKYVIFFTLIIISLGVRSQSEHTYIFEFKDYKKALLSKDSTLFDSIKRNHNYFSIRKGNRTTFNELPVELLSLRHDLFLMKKPYRAEYSIGESDSVIVLWITDVLHDLELRLVIKSFSSNYFVFFRKSRRKYLRVKECRNCEFEEKLIEH